MLLPSAYVFYTLLRPRVPLVSLSVNQLKISTFPGSEVDEANLTNLLEQLGFEVYLSIDILVFEKLCDQIWQNFATLAKFLPSLEGSVDVFQNF